MTPDNQAAMLILQLIDSHDGEWGWYQLDRAVSMRGVPGGRLMHTIQELRDGGLLSCDGDPQLASTRFRLTPNGRALLKSGGGTTI